MARIDRRSVQPEDFADGQVYVGLEHIETGGHIAKANAVNAGDLKSSKFAFDTRHVLFGKLRPNLAKVARPPFEGVCSTDIVPILPGPNLDRDYLANFLLTRQIVDWASSRTSGVNLPRLSPSVLEGLEIPLPPLPEQRRIASTLDEAARLRSMSASGSHEAENLGAAFFRSLFENPARLDGGEVLPLGTVSEVVSGITKGRRTSDPTREVPYLTVANVQDRRLRLGLVKTIEATETEITRYRLRRGDILLTEGGDPDKLGRGAMWNGELDEVIHQNHVFRVRVRDQRLRPEYVSWLMSSARGRKYFASAAKQTTGIASINSTQLKAFPVPIPSTALQNEFAERLDESARIVARQVDQLAKLDELFASLQHRAFLGEL